MAEKINMLVEGDAAAWTLNVTNQFGDLPDNTSCGEGHFWYGWGGEGNTDGSISTILTTTVFGPAELTFGNCGLDGEVLIYLDGIEIASAGPNTERQSITFNFEMGSVLELQESDGIIKFFHLELECETTPTPTTSGRCGSNLGLASGWVSYMITNQF